MLLYTRYCNCFLDYDYVLHIVNFAILYSLTARKGMRRTFSNSNPHGSPFNRLLRHAMGCWGPILTRILTAFISKKSKHNLDVCSRVLVWIIRVASDIIQNSEVNNVSNVITFEKSNTKSSIGQHGLPTKEKVGSGTVYFFQLLEIFIFGRHFCLKAIIYHVKKPRFKIIARNGST
jgi:hypothetical protein